MVDIFYVGNQEPMWQMVDELEHDKHRGWRCAYSDNLEAALTAIKERKIRNQGQVRKGIYVLVNWEINEECINQALEAGAHYIFRTTDNPRYIVRAIEDIIHRKTEVGEIVENGIEDEEESTKTQ